MRSLCENCCLSGWSSLSEQQSSLASSYCPRFGTSAMKTSQNQPLSHDFLSFFFFFLSFFLSSSLFFFFFFLISRQAFNMNIWVEFVNGTYQVLGLQPLTTTPNQVSLLSSHSVRKAFLPPSVVLSKPGPLLALSAALTLNPCEPSPKELGSLVSYSSTSATLANAQSTSTDHRNSLLWFTSLLNFKSDPKGRPTQRIHFTEVSFNTLFKGGPCCPPHKAARFWHTIP